MTHVTRWMLIDTRPPNANLPVEQSWQGVCQKVSHRSSHTPNNLFSWKQNKSSTSKY